MLSLIKSKCDVTFSVINWLKCMSGYITDNLFHLFTLLALACVCEEGILPIEDSISAQT